MLPRRGRPPPSSAIGRTFDTQSTTIQHVRVDHGRRHVAVTQQLRNRSNVATALQEMRRERVPEGMTRRPLGDLRSPDRALEHGLVQVVPAPLSCLRVAVSLPRPVPPRGRQLPRERLRQRHPSRAVAAIPVVLLLHARAVLAEIARERARSHAT